MKKQAPQDVVQSTEVLGLEARSSSDEVAVAQGEAFIMYDD
jgi:hypothetical protein